MLSFAENIVTILKASQGYKRVLDVGPAYSKYGLLLREQYLSTKAGVHKELIPIDDIIIDCSEITQYFLDRPALKAIYNNVYAKDMFDWTPEELKAYDLILLIDIVEHYGKDRMKAWLSRVKTNMLISTPKHTVMYKEAFYGDPHNHQSQWDRGDFDIKQDFSTAYSHIFII